MSCGDPKNALQGSPQSTRPVTRSDALGSHAVSVLTSGRNRSTGDTGRERPATSYHRRNTLPSVAFSELEAQALSRPFHESAIKTQNNLITHDDHHDTTHDDRRRSRSADALRKLYTSQDTEAIDRQDRSSAITYWRNSVILNPLPKLTDATDNPTMNQSTLDYSRSNTSIHRSQIQPVQSFDFGLNIENEPVDLEERVNTLEVKMYDFEYAIAKLQGVELSKPVLPLKPNRKRSTNELLPPSNSRSRSTSRSASRAASRSVSRSTVSSYQGVTFLASPCPSPMPTTETEVTFQPDRASKTLTIRPSGSRRPHTRSNAPSPASAKLSHDQFDILMSIIQDEKAARQQMEMQLMELQKEVELLQAPIYATIRPLDYAKSESHPNSPIRAKRLHRSPPFELVKAPATEVSRFSMAESDVESESFEESFETPQENRFVFESSRGSPLISTR